jgi:hypothetical protein
MHASTACLLLYENYYVWVSESLNESKAIMIRDDANLKYEHHTQTSVQLEVRVVSLWGLGLCVSLLCFALLSSHFQIPSETHT